MIPAIIISGYLGAGKTTLIRDFLNDPKGLKATILVNDFGQINLDAELIAETGADTIALTNGCACCSIGDDLLGAAQNAVAQEPDLIVIEASGVARPARLKKLLHGVMGLEPAGCLTVVNLLRANDLMADRFVGTLFRQQIEEADALCLNRAGPHKSASVENLLKLHPRVADIHGFRQSRFRPPAHDGIAPEQPKPAFKEQVLHPPAMTRVSAERWLSRFEPAPHRAKGVLPLIEDNSRVCMAWIDLVQGETSFRMLPDMPAEAQGRIVVITPVG